MSIPTLLLPLLDTPRRMREWRYRAPNPCDTYEQWLVAYSLDLPVLDDAALRSEGRRCMRRLDVEPPDTSRNRLISRIAAIRAEMHRREGRR
jgi:hypothetical protein